MTSNNSKSMLTKSFKVVTKMLKESATGNNGDGCILTTIATQRIISSSPVETHTEGFTNVQTAQSNRSDPGDPLLEHTMLVPDGLASDQRAPSDHETQQDVDFSRLEIISAHNKNDDLDKNSIQFLQHAHRRRTHQLYNRR